MQPLVIIGVDSGMATCGVCRIACQGDRIVADYVAVVRTSPLRRFTAAVAEDMRLREVAGALQAAQYGQHIHALAYEYYRPFQRTDGTHSAARGRLVSKAEGVAVGFGLAIGARTIPIDPAEPKRWLGAHNKADVSQVLEARIDGLTELLDQAGRTGYHGSDAAACAYMGMIKIFNAQRKR